jgi:hypothetical protein
MDKEEIAVDCPDAYERFHDKKLILFIAYCGATNPYRGTLSVKPNPTRVSVEISSNIKQGQQYFLTFHLSQSAVDAIEDNPHTTSDLILRPPLALSPDYLHKLGFHQIAL